MAGQLLTLLDDAGLDFTPEPPEFEALAAAHLAGLENVESAIDLDLLDVAAAVEDAPLVLAGMDTDHDELIAQAPEIAQDEATPLQVELAAEVAHGEQNMRDVDGSMLLGG